MNAITQNARRCLQGYPSAILSSWLVFAVILGLPRLHAQTWQWARYANSSAIDHASAVTVDAATGDVYVVGNAQGALSEYGIPTAVGYDGFCAKYKSNGNLVWAFGLQGVGFGDLVDVAVDSVTHKVYVVGTISGNTTMKGTGGPSPSGSTVGGQDALIACFDSAGVLQWYAVEGGLGMDVATSVVVDGGSIYVTGTFQTSINLRGAPMGAGTLLTGVGTQEWFLAKYDATTGVVQWGVGNQAGSNMARSNGVAVDANRVYITGAFNSATVGAIGTASTLTVANSSLGNLDIFAFGFRKTDGAALWGYAAGASGVDDEGNGLVSDGTGLYLTGRVTGNPVFAPLGAFAAGSIQDAFLSRHDVATGAAAWVNVIGSAVATDLQSSNDVSVQGGGNVAITGFFNGSVNFPNNTTASTILPSSGLTDLFLASFTSAGALNWATSAGTASSTEGCSDVAALDTKVAYVTGAYANSNSSIPTSPATPLPLEGLEDVFVAKYGLCFDYITTTLPVSANPVKVCSGSGSNVIVGSTQIGANYQLVDSATGLPVGSYLPGNGGNLNLPTGPIFGPTTYYVQGYFTSPICAQLLDNKVRINIWTPVVQATLGADTTLCPGSSMVLNPAPLPGIASYNWSTGATTSTITVSTAGSFRVTVTDVNGCIDADTIVVGLFPAPTVNIGPDISQCPGPGPVLDAGPGFVAYNWSNFQSTQSIVTSNAGSYMVTVTDGNGCTATDAMIYTIFPTPVVDLGPDVTGCNGSSLSFDAGPGLTTYSWGGGETTQSVLATTPGTYHVTVTNSNGCTDRDTANFAWHAPTAVNLGPDISSCPNTLSNLDAGPGFNGYSWSNGATSQTITPSAPGNYQVTVTDANGCTGTDTVIISWYSVPTLAIGSDTTVCAGGGITIDAGLAFSSYVWSNGAMTSSILANAPGTFSVTATDGNGCFASDTLVFDWDSLPTFDLGPDTSICTTQTLTLNPGPFLSYAWSGGQTSATLVVSLPGWYSVTVTDSLGCAGADSLLLSSFPNPVVNLGPDIGLCPGNDTLLNAGPGFVGYLWSNGDTTSTSVAAASGPYSVTVTDGNGCLAADTLGLTFFVAPVVNLGADTAICAGFNLLLNASTGFQAYLWNDGSTGNALQAMTPGSYSVTVTDLHGCWDSDSLVLNWNALPSPFLGPDTSICEGSSLTIMPGSGFSSYAWSDGSTQSNLVVAAAGSYQVSVVDMNGCSAADSLVLGIFALPQVSLGPDTTVCNGVMVQLDAGPGYLSYGWSGGSTSQSLLAAAGVWAVTVSDIHGCQDADTVVVAWRPTPVVTFSGLGLVYCVSDAAVALSGTPSGGSYWGAATPSGVFEPLVLGPGNHAVIYAFTDSLGCSAADTQSTSVVPLPSVADAGPDLSGTSGMLLNAASPTIGTGHWIAGTGIVISDSTASNAAVISVKNSPVYLFWTVENAPCPASFDTVFVTLDSLKIPTGFSPNGDLVNDYFVIHGIEDKTPVKLVVFNRWGVSVWQSEAYQNDWDGTNSSGAPLVDDTYYAIVQFGNQQASTYVVLKR